MINAFRNASTYSFVVVLIILLGLTGCENPGSLGSNVGQSKANVVIDTLSIDNLSTRNLNFYSGNFQFFSAGEFEDPLVGNVKATGMIKPALPSGSGNSLTKNSKMKMRIILEGGFAYGDSLAEQSFDIYEIDEIWRPQTIKLQDDIALDYSSGPISSFSVGGFDSLDVELPSEWVQKYRSYTDTTNADSLYERDLFGLALVPTNSKKIIAPNLAKTHFVVENPVAEDTFSVGSRQSAYTLDRNKKSLSPSFFAWHSTKEQVLTFDLDLSSVELQGPDISRAELVFYQNTDLMEQSLQLNAPSAVRPQPTRAQLHLVDPDELPANIVPGNPIADGFYSTDDQGFHFEITPQVQSALEDGNNNDKKYVVTLVNDGVIKTSIVYTNQASAENRPKLIITSLKNNSN